MKRTFDIAVLGGDGIGKEVIDQAIRLLREIEPRLDGASFRLAEHSIGVGEYLKNGDPLPQSAFAACQRSDAILLGAAGLPDVRYPNGKEIVPQIELRERLGLYGGIRPIRLFHESDTPLKDYRAGDIDFVLVRESTEGLFWGREAVADLHADEATNVMRVTRRGVERVCRLAFQLARKRADEQHRKPRVTLVDKANVLSSMVYFRHVFNEVAKEFPDVSADHYYVDAMALYLIRQPREFDVLVTENMFGDILSDLAAGLVGGMGMAPSADMGDQIALFQPAHGSAPDIAGRGIANPIAMILSTALMLEWLDHPETKRGASALQAAVGDVLSDPARRTPDMGGQLSTVAMTDAVSKSLHKTLQSG